MVPTELAPTCLRLKPDADGRDFACLSSAGGELRRSSFQVLVTSRAPGYPEEGVGPVRFGGTELDRTLAGEICLVGSGVSMVPVLLQCARIIGRFQNRFLQSASRDNPSSRSRADIWNSARMETISLPSSLRSSFKCDHIGSGSACLGVSLFDHRALKSAVTKLLRISGARKSYRRFLWSPL